MTLMVMIDMIRAMEHGLGRMWRMLTDWNHGTQMTQMVMMNMIRTLEHIFACSNPCSDPLNPC
jgi:hypothetical protein